MKHFKLIFITGLLVLSSVLWNCYYDNEEQLYPTTPDNNCDSVNISFSGHIAKTLSSYCYGCHGATYKQTGNGIQLNTYSGVSKNIDRIIKAITHDPDYANMPKGAAKLNECRINQFIIWKNNGTPNN